MLLLLFYTATNTSLQKKNGSTTVKTPERHSHHQHSVTLLVPVHLAGQDVGAVSPRAPTLSLHQMRLPPVLMTIGVVVVVTRVVVT